MRTCENTCPRIEDCPLQRLSRLVVANLSEKRVSVIDNHFSAVDEATSIVPDLGGKSLQRVEKALTGSGRQAADADEALSDSVAFISGIAERASSACSGLVERKRFGFVGKTVLGCSAPGASHSMRIIRGFLF